MKRKTALYRVYCDTLEEVQECIESPEFIRPLLIEGCRRMLSSRRKTLSIADIFSLDTYAVINVAIRRDEIEEVLEKTLRWYEDREEYEECSEVVELLNRARKINIKKEKCDETHTDI